MFISFVKFAARLVTFVRFTKPSVSLLSKKHTPLEHKVCVKNARFTMARTRLTRKNEFCDTSVWIDDMSRTGFRAPNTRSGARAACLTVTP